MSLRANDHKDVHGAYRERQKVLYNKDGRMGKSSSCSKPWKKSKGYGTRAGRVAEPGRNYGHRKRERIWWFSWTDGELEEDDDTETDGQERQAVQDPPLSYSADESVVDVEMTIDGESEEESYELQLARALSLSLVTAEASHDDECDVESLQDAFDGDTDEYSLMGTDSDAMDADSGYETDASGETEWVNVDEFGTDSERPTYAQMTKVEVT